MVHVVVRVLLGPWDTKVSRKGMKPSSLGFLSSELDVGVLGVDMLEELVTMFCLLDDKGVTHKPEP